MEKNKTNILETVENAEIAKETIAAEFFEQKWLRNNLAWFDKQTVSEINTRFKLNSIKKHKKVISSL